MIVVVTGASGFTGSHLTRALVQAGHRVRVLVRRTSSLENLKELDVEIVRGDIRDPQTVEQAVKGSEIVYHVAACFRQAGVGDGVYQEVHVDGTEHVLRAALKHEVNRVVHCSTVGIHGHVAHPPADESAPFNPSDIYQRTKLAGEQLAWAFSQQTGLPLTVIRPAGIYGPGDIRMLKFYQLVQRRRFFMLGSGQTFYHFTYISDLIDGFLLAAKSERSVGQAYIIGGEHYLTLQEWVNMLADELGAPYPKRHLPLAPFYAAAALCEAVCVPFGIEPPLFRRRVDIFVKDRAFDISKARRELNYQPKIDLKTGIHLTAEWYRAQGWL